jgi:hypothetical protein
MADPAKGMLGEMGRQVGGRPLLLPEEITAKTSGLRWNRRSWRAHRPCRFLLRIVFLVLDENPRVPISGLTAERFRLDRASAPWHDVMGFILRLFFLLLLRIHPRWRSVPAP